MLSKVNLTWYVFAGGPGDWDNEPACAAAVREPGLRARQAPLPLLPQRRRRTQAQALAQIVLEKWKKAVMSGSQLCRVTGGLADGWWAAASATYCPGKNRTTRCSSMWCRLTVAWLGCWMQWCWPQEMTFSDVKRTLICRGGINHAVQWWLLWYQAELCLTDRGSLCVQLILCAKFLFSLTSSVLSPKQRLEKIMSRLLTPARASWCNDNFTVYAFSHHNQSRAICRLLWRNTYVLVGSVRRSRVIWLLTHAWK